MIYSEKVKQEVIRLHKEGLSLSIISDKLNMPRTSAYGIIKRSGHHKPVRGKVTENVYSLVKQLLEVKLQRKEIAKIVKLSLATIDNIKTSDDLEGYKKMLIEESHFSRKKFVKKLDEIKPVDKKEIEFMSDSFDKYNSIMVKLGALEYQVAKLTKLVEDTQTKKFRLF